jgi:hypothetical protein
MGMPVIVPVGQKTAEAVSRALAAKDPELRVSVATDPARNWVRSSPPNTRRRSKAISSWLSTRAPNSSSTGEAGAYRAMRRGFLVADPDRSHHAFNEEEPQDEIFGPVLQDVRGGAEVPDPPPPRQRGFAVHAQWRCGPAFHRRGRDRHGGRQVSDAGAGRLLQPWRVE